MKLNGRKFISILQDDGPLPIQISKMKQHQDRHLYVSNTDVFVGYRESLMAKDFVGASSGGHDYPDPNIKFLRNKSSKITCIGLGKTSFLLCTCSDDAVYLWKKDSLLREWSRKKVVKSVGKVLHCSVFSTDYDIFITLSKSNEIIIIHCVSHVKLEPNGSLDLSVIEIYASIDKIKEPNAWVTCFESNGKLCIIGLAESNGISLRLWNVSRNKSGVSAKLLDHKTISQIKSVASADIMTRDDDLYLALFGNDGQIEMLLVQNGFSVINRIRFDDTSAERGPDSIDQDQLSKQYQPQPQSMKAEFRVIYGRFIDLESVDKNQSFNSQVISTEKQPVESNDSADNSNLIPVSVNSGKLHCPQVLALVASTKKIYFLDLRSGEVELTIKYEDLDKNIGLLVKTIAITFDPAASDVVGALQLMMDKNVYFFRIGVSTGVSDRIDNSSCFLISSDNYSKKSVLRKKLKSPKNPPKVTSKSMAGIKSRNVQSQSKVVLALAAATKCNDDLGKRARSRSEYERGDFPRASPRTGFPLSVPSSPRQALILETKASYNHNQLFFDSTNSVQLPQRLSESGISSVRLELNSDGKLMAAGANVSPLLVLKTQPIENVRLFKDLGRISSLKFDFNSKYLLLATNECKTTVLDWRGNKELVNFKFSSKFNEHVGSQFYFMDKFILQGEENRLALYSYAFGEGGNIYLQAGNFPLACQSITAFAAANQFYSNFIICGLSSKCLQVFDANVEKVVVNIPQSHSRPVTCIRLNEAPKGSNATAICNFVLTSAPSAIDPIKLWDLRTSKSASVIGDVNVNAFVSPARPALSPCGRYIATGFEDNKVILYDVRKINSKMYSLDGIRSTILDCAFDPSLPLLWCAARNGALWSFIAS